MRFVGEGQRGELAYPCPGQPWARKPKPTRSRCKRNLAANIGWLTDRIAHSVWSAYRVCSINHRDAARKLSSAPTVHPRRQPSLASVALSVCPRRHAQCKRFLSGVVPFDFSSRHNPPEFNDTELGMDKLESHISKEAAWRGRLRPHAQSCKSVAPFARMKRSQRSASISGVLSRPLPMGARLSLFDRWTLSISAPSKILSASPRLHMRRRQRRTQESTSGSSSAVALS